MSGHLFAFHGDLTQFACDAWLLPSDRRAFVVKRHWCDGNPWPLPPERLVREPTRILGDRLVAPLSELHPEHPDPRRVWLGNIGRRGLSVDHAVTVLYAFLEEAAADLEAGGRFIRRREKPLLGVPLVGTGMGGARDRSSAIVDAVVETAERFTRTHDVDVALVARSDEDHAAVQGARRARLGARESWDLPARWLDRAEALAEQAAAGKLALFLGAGVSVGANLPLWDELLAQIAARADPSLMASGALDTDFARLGPLDQAAWLERSLARRGGDLRQVVQSILGEYKAYSLCHGLLASLPVRECITTNYDDLFEQASFAAERPAAVLPWRPDPSRVRWLLKMHGDVADAESIVLTRESYLRYGARNEALAGIVQATLITRHMLFVGFSMGDENFHRIVDAVRRAVGSERAFELGDVTAVSDFGFQKALWEGELRWIDLFDDSGVSAAARRLEIFLDYLNFRATGSTHLLHERFARGLSEEDKALRALLIQVRDALADAPDSPGWRRVARLLRDFGHRK